MLIALGKDIDNVDKRFYFCYRSTQKCVNDVVWYDCAFKKVQRTRTCSAVKHLFGMCKCQLASEEVHRIYVDVGNTLKYCYITNQYWKVSWMIQNQIMYW